MVINFGFYHRVLLDRRTKEEIDDHFVVYFMD